MPARAGRREKETMIRLPFSRKPKGEGVLRPSAAFLAYCEEELERMRDVDEALDEPRFQAAVKLAVQCLENREEEKKS
jgi:hypothetical protein